MTFDRTFPKWRQAGSLELWVPAGTKHRRVFLAKGPEFAAPAADFHSWPLDLDDFHTGPSDYEMPSDEAYCPCGHTLRDWGVSAGELLRAIYRHCGAAGHPMPRFDR
jgi:hypothetical protein